MTGAIAANLHEGSRSEYLAQYVFASFGTAVAIPHQEDSGVDLYCTLTERIGQLAWPMAHYSVQVKSSAESWKFTSPTSVRWLVEHPFPLFLCIVDKSTAQLRVYHTSPRFYLWSIPPLPDSIELIPTDGVVGTNTQWEGGKTFSLGAPVLNFSIQDLIQDEQHTNIDQVLKYWIQVEQENLHRVRTGIRSFTMPFKYQTNIVPADGWAIQGISRANVDNIQQAIQRLKELLSWIGPQLYFSGDLEGGVQSAILLRHLTKEHMHLIGFRLPDVYMELNRIFGTEGDYLYSGADKLNAVISGFLQGKSLPEENNI